MSRHKFLLHTLNESEVTRVTVKVRAFSQCKLRKSGLEKKQNEDIGLRLLVDDEKVSEYDQKIPQSQTAN